MGKIYSARELAPVRTARTRDSLLKPGELLHAETVGKVLALGRVWTGVSVIDDMEIDALGDALSTLPAGARGRIAERIAQFGGSGSRPDKVDGAGTARVGDADSLRAMRDRASSQAASMNREAEKFWDKELGKGA